MYKSDVCSQLTYGSEVWSIDDRTARLLNGANSKMVSRITGRTIREEVDRDKTFDLVRWIRVRRLRWLGHILRMHPDRGSNGPQNCQTPV